MLAPPLCHQVDACSLLCHEEAKHLHVLTVEVWTGDLERMAAKRKRLHSIPVSLESRFWSPSGVGLQASQLA